MAVDDTLVGSSVCIISHTGQYLGASASGSLYMVQHCLGWEVFQIENHEGDKYRILTAHGMYLCAVDEGDQVGAMSVIGMKKVADESCVFTISEASEDSEKKLVIIRSHSGKFLTSEPLVALSPSCTESNYFKIVLHERLSTPMAVSPAPPSNESKLRFLQPPPHTVKVLSQNMTLTGDITVSLGAGLTDGCWGERVRSMLRPTQLRISLSTNQNVSSQCIVLQINQHMFSKPESYNLIVESNRIHVIGADEPGVFYGMCTLVQIFRLCRPTSTEYVLPCVRILDSPSFRARGVMLDISRDKVPKLSTIFELVDTLASLKYNQVKFQLYMEHTFAYEGHSDVWCDASPLTSDDLLALDAFCRERFVELVPNQNSFGHMNRWLNKPKYTWLAECPQSHYPQSICPTDKASLNLLDDLYTQLLPNFSSKMINVGLDETFDLGSGRSRELCDKEGTAKVYMKFLKDIHQLVTKKKHTMMFWGDIVLNHPEVIPDIPKDAIALSWGYEANHPFDKQLQLFQDSALSFYVCPGTSSWLTFGGRTSNAMKNLHNAAKAGAQYNACGYLVTDWGDGGHLQPLVISYLGFLVGAAYAWNASNDAVEMDVDVGLALDLHVFMDEAKLMGKLAMDLGNAYLQISAQLCNASALYSLVCLSTPSPDLLQVTSISELSQCKAYMENIRRQFSNTRMNRHDADLIVQEFEYSADMLIFGCTLGVAVLSNRPADDTSKPSIYWIPRTQRGELIDQMTTLIATHEKLWNARNRVGGLRESRAYLLQTCQFLAHDPTSMQ